MSHDEFDHKMNKLRKKLENAETETSAQEIFQTVQQKNEKRKKQSVFPVIAASIVALLVGGVLFGSLFFTDEAGENNDPQEIGTPADTVEEDSNDESETEEETDPSEDSSDETTTEETTTNEEQQDESNEEETTEETTENDDAYLNREELITETVYPEGMEEDIRMRLISNEHLGYSSYVHEPMIYREQMENEKSVDYYYVDFAEIGEIQYENSFIRIEKFEGMSVDEVIAAREDRMERNGFSEQAIPEQLEGSSFHSMYLKDDLVHYLTIVESNNAIFAVDSQMITVMGDGTFPWIIESFVKNMQFAE